MTNFESSLILQLRKYFEDASTCHYKKAIQEYTKLTHIIKTIDVSEILPVSIDMYKLLWFCTLLTKGCGKFPDNVHNCIILQTPKMYTLQLGAYLAEHKRHDSI